MAGWGPSPAIWPDSVPRATFSTAAAALGPDIVGNGAERDNMRRKDGCGRDAAPGSGHASSARPRGHYLGLGSRWMSAPEGDEAPAAGKHGRILATFGEPAISVPRRHRPTISSASYIIMLHISTLYTQKYTFINSAWGFGVLG